GEQGRSVFEDQHTRRIPRSFALAAKPVTVGQFRAFNTPSFTKRYAPDEDCPVIGISWFEAGAYCNWLSRRDGIPEDQLCYEVDAKGNATNKLKKNYLSLTGYRLPTEAEMEYATRAGTATSRYYGETTELLDYYAWNQRNSGDRTRPVGTK